MSVREGGGGRSPRRRDLRVVVAPLALGAAIVAVPAVVLMASAGRTTPGSSAVADTVQAEAKTDREARVTFRVRPGVLGMRMLRDAPPRTRAIRGRAVRILCGSVAGLESARVRWPDGASALAVELAVSPARTEFCAIKRGGRSVARVVLG